LRRQAAPPPTDAAAGDAAAVATFARGFVGYLRTTSPVGELRHLAALGVVSPTLATDLPLHRAAASTSPPAAAAGGAGEGAAAAALRVTLELDDLDAALRGQLAEMGRLPTARTAPSGSSGNGGGGAASATQAAWALGGAGLDDPGLLARAVEAVARRRSAAGAKGGAGGMGGGMGLGGFFAAAADTGSGSSSNSSSAPGGGGDVLSAFEHIESPLQQLKRAGMGLLSRGLGSLGFQAPVAGPADTGPVEAVVVVCVVGGLSYVEVGQVQAVLDQSSAAAGGALDRVIFVAPAMLPPESCVCVAIGSR
jgi:hypothetical protein